MHHKLSGTHTKSAKPFHCLALHLQAEGFGKETTLWPLHEPVKFQHEVDFELSSAPAWVLDKAPSSGIKWTARVSHALLPNMLFVSVQSCSGPDLTSFFAVTLSLQV